MRILFVDKENIFDEILNSSQEDYVIDYATSADDGQFLYEINSYDAILVDYSISDFDISCVRDDSFTQQPPIAVITESNDTDSQIDALEKGADLIIQKPVTYPLISTAIKSMVAKKVLKGNASYTSSKNLKVNFFRKTVFLNGKILNLRRKEYDILEYLVINKDRIVSKEQIAEHLWHPDSYVFNNTIEVHIKNIRDKIDQEKPSSIKTVRGFGYKFVG